MGGVSVNSADIFRFYILLPQHHLLMPSNFILTMHAWRAYLGEAHSSVYILLRGEMHVLGMDRRSFLFKVPEGTVFGETVALRQMEVKQKIVVRLFPTQASFSPPQIIGWQQSPPNWEYVLPDRVRYVAAILWRPHPVVWKLPSGTHFYHLLALYWSIFWLNHWILLSKLLVIAA